MSRRRSHLFTQGLWVQPVPGSRAAGDCRSIETTPSYVLGLQYHQCDLQRYHYGKHQCWCGWTFGTPEENEYQTYLPLFGDEPA